MSSTGRDMKTKSRDMKTMNRTPRGRPTGLVKLLLSLGAVLLIWCIVLPGLSKLDRNATYLDWLEAKGIDPSAMFYTDLDCMEELIIRTESVRKDETIRHANRRQQQQSSAR